MDQNLLLSGTEKIAEIRAHIVELDSGKVQIEELALKDERLEKDIANKEREVYDEINDTIKKRKDEITKTFRDQEDNLRAEEKKTRSKKEKTKSGKVSERIEAETVTFVDENKQLAIDAKDAFKKRRVPAILNSGFYYTLFMPKSAGEIFTDIVIVIIVFGLAPFGVYYLLHKPAIWILALLYVGFLLVLGGAYILIHNSTKGKYTEALIEGRRIRNRIQANKKAMLKKKKSIQKDKDESGYGLEGFDSEIEELQRQIEETANRRKMALQEFENTTKNLITEEIKNRNQTEIDQLKAEHDRVHSELKETKDMVKVKSLFVAQNYEAFLGKEFSNITVLDRLTEIIQSGAATNIGEALAVYKNDEP